ncbi:MCE family protein [Nocardia sp. ET3-3]|uniref:MCE family protein n=1 Tax=Nocardia terrae TaxID=2675851 RepID=A0A7K1V2B2_9NOCA|nr:MlaD family protein [Nocardia terrae]MVU80776.1 MCE family protein [Nocardia terrae]
MTKNRKKLIGIAATATVTAVIVGGAGVVVASDVSPDSSTGYCADMPDAIGVYPGNPVTQMGYRVGSVSKVRPAGDHVEVTFSLDSGRRYPADVKAVTRSKSLLADRTVELVGNYESGPELKPGGCIPVAHSFTPKSISQIAGSAADFIDAMAPEKGSQSLQQAISGFDNALRGQGENASAMMRHAASAATSPDQLISDIGSSILDMAPLTDEALQRWSTISSILDQLPDVVAAGVNLWPGTIKLLDGVATLIAVLYNVQRNYGDMLWPLMQGGVADVIHLAATRSKDLASLLDSIPPVAAMLRQQSAGPDGPTLTYQPPTVDVGTGAPVPVTGILDMVVAKGNR